VATHSSILAWRSLRTEEPGRLQSTGLQRERKIARLGGQNERNWSSLGV